MNGNNKNKMVAEIRIELMTSRLWALRANHCSTPHYLCRLSKVDCLQSSYTNIWFMVSLRLTHAGKIGIEPILDSYINQYCLRIELWTVCRIKLRFTLSISPEIYLIITSHKSTGPWSNHDISLFGEGSLVNLPVEC